MDAEEKELRQHQSDAQVFIKRVGANLGDVQQPHAETADHYQRDSPEFPGHHRRDQCQHPAERRCDHGKQQVSACLLLRLHRFSSTCEIRSISSWGGKGFFR